MFAEVVPIDMTLSSQEKFVSFALDNLFTDNHQINLVVEDDRKQHAIFVTQSFEAASNQASPNATDNNLIDSVTLTKINLGADDKLSYKQMTIALPEKQVNAKIICTLSDMEDSVYCYFLY